MIRNDQDLAFVQEQLALLERGLERLRQEVKNERNFELYSEAYVDQIAELKADIAEYRARQSQQQRAGPNGDAGEARSPAGVREGGLQ